jgi:hypothetical protein
MVDEIVCHDCDQVFYDLWDADHHVCYPPAITPAAAYPDPPVIDQE